MQDPSRDPGHQEELTSLPTTHSHTCRGRRLTSIWETAHSLSTPLPLLPGPAQTRAALCCRSTNALPLVYSPVLLWRAPWGRPSPICTWTQLPRGGSRGGGSGSWGSACFRSSVSVLWGKSGDNQPSTPPASPSARSGLSKASPSHRFSLCGPGQLFQPLWPPFSLVIDLIHPVSPPRHDL